MPVTSNFAARAVGSSVVPFTETDTWSLPETLKPSLSCKVLLYTPRALSMLMTGAGSAWLS